MGLKADSWITKKALNEEMIKPFHQESQQKGVISYGISSYGYDICISDEFKIFTNINAHLIDPKTFSENNVLDFKGNSCIIPPNSFALARSLEYIKMPKDVLAICLGKSTYARCGIIINVTPIEPAWEGHITIEISNTTPLPCKIYANEGIAQLLFFQGDDICLQNYKSKLGKYQYQKGITLPKIK